jgi:hypothetical protein
MAMRADKTKAGRTGLIMATQDILRTLLAN